MTSRAAPFPTSSRPRSSPLGIYYLAMARGGIFAAIIAALAWDYACIAFRLVRRKRIPGILVLASLGLTARTILALASHSAFLYFLQPCLSTAGVGLLFAVSILVGRPLAAKLAHDFVPMPAGFCDRPEIRKVFVQITGVWAVVNVINGAAALALLLTQPIAIYNLEKTGEAHFVTALGVAVSAWWFMRTVRRHRHLPQLSIVSGL